MRSYEKAGAPGYPGVSNWDEYEYAIQVTGMKGLQMRMTCKIADYAECGLPPRETVIILIEARSP